MAKKVPGKSLNRKAKRTVRRSLAAILMVTAIAIAAIPVPDIQADTDLGDTASSGGRDWEGILADGQANRTPADYARATEAITDEIIDGYSITNVGGLQEYETQTIKAIDNNQDNLVLTWRFKYFPESADSAYGIISQYNNQYNESVVDLTSVNQVTDYLTVEVENYSEFYSTGLGVDISLHYDDWHNATDNFKKFGPLFSKFFSTDYATFLRNCEKYLSEEIAEAPSIRKMPTTDLATEELKFQFFCDADTDISRVGSGLTLRRVRDNRSSAATGGTASFVYVVKKVNNNSVISIGAADENGFIGKEVSLEISGIGDSAFKGITNIDTIKLPSNLKYIGNEAFANSFISAIEIQNTTAIGYRAFAGCGVLKNVDFKAAVQDIGPEAFYGCNELTSITLPYAVRTIGTGAFANCGKLSTANLDGIREKATIGKYAFYNCTKLTSVQMSGSEICRIEDGAFAVSSADEGFTEIELPPRIAAEEDLGNHLFANRTKLTRVVFPDDLGLYSSGAAKLGDSIFWGCLNLTKIEFPASCRYVTYDPYLFADVTDSRLEVSGPELDAESQPASPRVSTWGAVTKVNPFVPYNYVDGSGVSYYEICTEEYLLTANQSGVLTSCKITPGITITPTDIDLVIPSKVGTIDIKSIATECFSEEALRNEIKTITIEDNSVNEIAAATFQSLPKLEKLSIGNSVNTIGDRAFEGCNRLVDVTFNSPASGNHAAVTIGTDAFKTGSSELTFHGDIVESYAPYAWAMSPDNYINQELGIRVCYKSLDPTNLTVIYDNATKLRTLLDYPKYATLDLDHKDYIDRTVATYYEKYRDSAYDDQRAAFLADWEENGEAAYDNIYYGPWVNAQWISDNLISFTGSAPSPYFDIHKYSIIRNKEEQGEYEWQMLTPAEESWAQATTNIVVPVGVDSIDVAGYLGDTQNGRNADIYLRSSPYYTMYKDATEDVDGVDSVPGLFSGYFQDYDDQPNDGEKKIRGNDRVESITLNSVVSLPDYAFDSCEKLKSVVIGKDCQDIGTAPFRGCDSLTDVNFDNNPKYFADSAGLIYSIKDDGSYLIEECLPSRVGTINSISNPDITKVSEIREGAFEDCASITEVDLSTAEALKIIPQNAFKNCSMLKEVIFSANVNRIEEGAFKGNNIITATIPGIEVHIATDAFEHTEAVKLLSYRGSAVIEYAQYHGLSWGYLDGTYAVRFLDYDGSQIGETQYVEEGKNATPPANPVREGYTFTGWSGEYLGITADTILVAQYKSNSSGGDGNGGGSGTDEPSDGKNYTVTVVNGSGSGSYVSGSTITISANAPASGKVFDYWSTTDGLTFANINSATTTFRLPNKNVTVTAVYKNSSSSGNNSNSNSNKNNGSSTASGNDSGTGTKVTINKPGISNENLASAVVNGSKDGFIVRITETAEATQAVEAALTAEYGSLENIQYFAMDITLWDANGTTKITDTTGITVDITIPIPDALIAYGGNNKASGVVNNKLDKLSPKFTTIDGVSCITFRATHFSPYAIYVDTNNLTAGSVLDNTPKTGDGIHPKWFLAIGLACVSVILFLKRDKVETKKTKLA